MAIAYLSQKDARTVPFRECPICVKVNGKIFAQVHPDKITKVPRFQWDMIDLAYEAVITGFSKLTKQKIPERNQ